MTIETTLAMVKPDGMALRYAEAIKKEYLAAGLEINDDFYVILPERGVAEFYLEHISQPYFVGIKFVMTDRLCRVFILKGENAIKTVRDLNGAKVPAPGTIRDKFPSAGGPCNVVHSSDSSDSFVREFLVLKKYCLS